MNEGDLSFNQLLNTQIKFDEDDSNIENLELKYSKFLRENQIMGEQGKLRTSEHNCLEKITSSKKDELQYLMGTHEQ